MLRPTKHMNPDRSVLALAAIILGKMRTSRVMDYSSLLEYSLSRMPDADSLFAGALSLLYLLGLIEYRSMADSFEYVGS